MKKVFLLVCFLSLGKLVAQDIDYIDYNNYVPPTALAPEVALLHRFVDIPVGYFTGTVKVSIPVVDISLKGLTIPISLEYSSSGLKMDEISSCIGAGWSLNSGGLMSSNIRGINDLSPQGGYTKTDKLPNPYYGNNSFSYEQLVDISGATSDPQAPKFDSEPDMHYYSYPGNSGKYVFDRNGNAMLIPKKPIKIEGHTIIDENGIIYEYGVSGGSESEDINSNTHPGQRLSIPTHNSTYYLTKITTPNGEIVNFEYTGVSYTYTYLTLTKYKNLTAWCGPQYTTPYEGMIEVYILEQRLDRITTNKGHKVEFVYNIVRSDIPSGKELNQINYSYDNKTIKSFILEHGYFTAKDPGSEIFKNKRLKLTKFYETGLTGYIFDYYTEDKISKLNSYSQDMYGYNNGKNNASLVPPFPDETIGADRNFDSYFLKAGTLQTMTLPAGGKHIFDYESNSAGPQNKYVGGLRIKSIKEFDTNNSLIKEKYLLYTKPESNESSGVENTTPIYVQNLTRWAKTGSGDDATCTMCSYQTYEAHSHTSSNLNGVAGGNVFYGYVTELIGPNGIGGKNLYEYTSYRDKGNSAIRPFTPEIDYSWARGSLLSKTSFAYNSGTFYPILKEINDYYFGHDFLNLNDIPNAINNEDFIGGCLVDVFYPECIEVPNSAGIPSIIPASLSQASYKYISAWFYLKSKETRTYNLNTPISEIDNSNYFIKNLITFKYSPTHLLLTESEREISSGDILNIKIKYPSDYVFNLSSTITDPLALAIKKLQDDHSISTPVEIYKELNTKPYEGNILHYTIDEFNHVNPSALYNLIIKDPNLPFSASIINNNILEFDSKYELYAQFDKYDYLGNLLQHKKIFDNNTSYFYAYHQNLPVVKAENIDLLTLSGQIIASLPAGFISLDELINSITIFPNSNWNLFNQRLRSQPALAGSLISTYTYSPLIGMTSQTDPNGKTIYYEYDDHGRLSAIKDNDGNILKSYDYHYQN